MCPVEGQQSGLHIPNNHVDWIARRLLQTRGRRQAGLAIFYKAEPSHHVLQHHSPPATEEGKNNRCRL